MLEIRHPPYMPGHTVQVVNTQTGAVATGNTTIPFDDTIPQNTEGDEYMTLAIKPQNANNKLKIDVVCFLTHSTGNMFPIVALFQDDNADALACMLDSGSLDGNAPHAVSFTHYMIAGTTNETTFKVRAGDPSAGTTTFNGSGGSRKMGGKMASSITITEIKA